MMKFHHRFPPQEYFLTVCPYPDASFRLFTPSCPPCRHPPPPWSILQDQILFPGLHHPQDSVPVSFQSSLELSSLDASLLCSLPPFLDTKLFLLSSFSIFHPSQLLKISSSSGFLLGFLLCSALNCSHLLFSITSSISSSCCRHPPPPSPWQDGCYRTRSCCSEVYPCCNGSLWLPPPTGTGTP